MNFSLDKSGKFSKYLNAHSSQGSSNSTRCPLASMEGPQVPQADIRRMISFSKQELFSSPEGMETLIQMHELRKRASSRDQTLHYNKHRS